MSTLFSLFAHPISTNLEFDYNAEFGIWQVTDNVPISYRTFLIDNVNLYVYAIVDDSKITDHVASVLAAIKISEADLKRLIQTSPQDKDREVPDKLSLEHLSHLYRIVSFAKALKVSIKEFLLAKSVIGIDSLFKNINTTLKFIKKLRRIEQSDFSIVDLAYVLNQQYEPNDNIAPSKLEIFQKLEEIRKEITQKINEFQDVAGTNASVAETRLATVLESQDVSEVVEMLKGSAVYTAPLARENILDAESKSILDQLKKPLRNKIKHSQDTLTFSGVMGSKERDTLLDLSEGAKYQTAIRTLFDQPRDFVEDKLGLILGPYFVEYNLGLIPSPFADREQLLDSELTVYEKFLIDVEMAPCMQTSRLKQAISSVQLFVQRCLMGLEPDVALTEESATEWKWRKYYRVWEANRKVFLYPENWIEPELRDDKSPFFEDLEDELLQSEVTEATVEEAFLEYLEKLEDVARLDIVGMYEQRQEDSADMYILHVFGRTDNDPHSYYYRQWINGRYWTSWTRVDVDIEGNHLIPVVWNRRLHLFWPLFRETGDEKNPMIEIKLAWSEYKNGKWSPKKVTSESKEIKRENITSTSEVTFKAQTLNNGDLKLLVYKPSGPADGHFYAFVQFHFTGCQGKILVEDTSSMRLYLPDRSLVHFMTFKEKGSKSDGSLRILKGIPMTAILFETLLEKTPGIFRILYPHQYSQFTLYNHFFYQEQKRTFFVVIGKRISSSGTKITSTFQPF